MVHLKGFLAVLVVAGLMWVGWTAYYEFLYQGQQPTVSTKLLNKLQREGVPNFKIVDYRGSSMMLNDLRGKVVVVNFWASWCDPCVEEFPSLIQLINHFKGEVVLLAISADRSLEDMKTFLKAYGIEGSSIQIMWDKDQAVAKRFGTFVLPESYVLNKRGRLIKKIAGVDNWYNENAIAYFNELVNAPVNLHGNEELVKPHGNKEPANPHGNKEPANPLDH